MVKRRNTSTGVVAVHEFGNGPVTWVALHGFTLSGASFARIARYLGGTIVAPDLPGHGATAVAPVDLDHTLAALGEMLETHEQPPVLAGYSQGGRIASHLAIRNPKLVSGLVMISASAGLAEADRAQRRVDDLRLADDIEAHGVDAFLEDWLTRPLTTTDTLDDLTRDWDRTLRSANTAAGLAAALRGLGQGALPRVDPASFEIPTLWLAGGADRRYSNLLPQLADAAGGSYQELAHLGHNVVLEDPAGVANALSGWAEGLA